MLMRRQTVRFPDWTFSELHICPPALIMETHQNIKYSFLDHVCSRLSMVPFSTWHSSHGHSVKNNTQYFGFYKWRSLLHMVTGCMPLSFVLPGRNYTLDGSKYSLSCVQIWKVRRALHSVCCSLPVVCLLCFCLDGSSVTRTSLLTGGCLLSQWCCCLHGHSCHGRCHLGGLFPVKQVVSLSCFVWNSSLCKLDALSVQNTFVR